MGRYIVKRFIMLIPILLAVVFIITALLYLSPGNPAELILGSTATDEQIRAWEDARGLNDPFLKQYFTYIWNIVTRFDFGQSFRNNSPVTANLLERLPKTLLLGFSSTIISSIIGVLLGIYAAKNRNKLGDSLLRGYAMLCGSVPTYVIALMLILIFSVKLRLLPASGFYGVEYIILPMLTVAISGTTGQMRFARSSMLDCMQQDYVRTARAKGQSESYITRHHILKNALIPIITMIGGGFANAVGGQVILEQIFAIPGLGKLMLSSIYNRDYPQIKGSVFLIAASVGIANVLIDIAYAYVDPRIKAKFASKHKDKKHKTEKREGAEAA